jgi:integrase
MSDTSTPASVHLRGLGSLRLRGTMWWVRYQHLGKRREESSGSSDQRVAERLLKRRVQESGRGQRVDPSAEHRVRMTQLFDMLVTDYEINKRRSAKDLQYRLQPLREYFDGLKARDVNGAVIAKYIAERQAAEMANGSINRELSALKRAFSIAVQQDRLSGAPYIKLLAESTPRQGFVRPGDLDRLVSHLPADLWDYARFAYATGARKDAIASLVWADIDRERQLITFPAEHDKAKTTRTISYAGVPVLFEVIERRWKARIPITPHVFHRAGRKIQRFTKSWRRACTAAGLHGLLFHDLRRSAVRNLVASGVDQVLAMKISGHKTASVFARYRIVNADDTAAALAKTAEALKQEAASNVRVLRPRSAAR